MTGLSCELPEACLFPNYNMLAGSLLKSQLFIDESPVVDTMKFREKRYIYFGPVPALLHLPFVALTGKGVPTGLAIVLFAAANCFIFSKILSVVAHDQGTGRFERILFTILFGLNGFMLLMVSLPTIHHEAILCATFFLLAGFYLALRTARDGYRLTFATALAIGILFSLALGSRFSYLLTVIFVLLALCADIVRNHPSESRCIYLTNWTVSIIAVAAGLSLLLAYNYARFENILDFGLNNPDSIFRRYYLQGNYFRYDHVPFNIWSYFFRLPELVNDSPFLVLPFYLHQVRQISGPPYFLLHGNELAGSVLVLMPVLLFAFTPLSRSGRLGSDFQKGVYRMLAVATVCQVTPLLFTVTSNARYYYDFLPIIIILAFLGMSQLTLTGKLKRGIAVAVAVLSIVTSASVVVNGLLVYETYISFRAPLLDLGQKLFGAP